MTYQPPQPPPGYGPPQGYGQPSHANPWFRRTWAIIVIAVVALLIGTGIGSSSAKKSAAKPGPTVTATTTMVSTAPAPPATTKTLRPTVVRTVATKTRTHTVTFTPAPKPAINDGTYKVGSDIDPGEWRTSGGQDCYYAILNSTDSGDIADNGDSTGQQIVTLNSGKYFEISGGCDWRHV